MNQPWSAVPAWYHAITLTERIASLQAVQGTAPTVAVNADHAERRMRRWRSQPPFATGSAFPQRLAMDGLSEEELLYLLGEPIEAVRDRFSHPPAWLAELARAFSRAPSAAEPIPPGASGDQGIAGPLTLIEPLVSQGRNRLRHAIQAIIQTQTDLPFNPTTVEDVLFA